MSTDACYMTEAEESAFLAKCARTLRLKAAMRDCARALAQAPLPPDDAYMTEAEERQFLARCRREAEFNARDYRIIQKRRILPPDDTFMSEAEEAEFIRACYEQRGQIRH